MTLPLVGGAAVLGAYMAEELHYRQNGRPQPGQEDLGIAFAAMSGSINAAVGAFLIAFPIGVWGSNRLLRRVWPQPKGKDA